MTLPCTGLPRFGIITGSRENLATEQCACEQLRLREQNLMVLRPKRHLSAIIALGGRLINPVLKPQERHIDGAQHVLRWDARVTRLEEIEKPYEVCGVKVCRLVELVTLINAVWLDNRAPPVDALTCVRRPLEVRSVARPLPDLW